MIIHPIPPFFDRDSMVLILGSFPSVKSREQGFYYGHKQNRFWKVISAIFEKDEPKSIDEKKDLLKTCKVAIWDVIGSCEIVGSADSSIKDVTVNDIKFVLNNSNIKRIFINGNTAKKYYDKFMKSATGIDAISLPSTSPANAVWTVEKLISTWKVIKE